MYRHIARAVLLAIFLSLSAPVMTYASPLDIEKVNALIEEIPEREDLQNSKEDTVMIEKIEEAMRLYNNLPASEKIQVKNYEKLDNAYKWGVNNKLIQKRNDEDTRTEDERMTEMEQKTLAESGETEKNATEYVFSVTESKNSASVVIRYTTDLDGDGYGDVPARLVITAPTGKTYAVTNSSAMLKEKGLNLIFSWEEKFVQIDMAEGPAGKWKIVSSDPVVFTIMPYAGERQEVIPEEEETAEEADVVDPEKETEEEEGKKKDVGGTVQIVLIVIVGIAFAIVGKKYGLFGSGNVEDDEDIDGDSGSSYDDDGNKKRSRRKGKKGSAEPRPKSDDEYMEEMRREFDERKRLEEEEEDDYDKDDYNNSFEDEDDDDEDGYTEYEETGNTGLLRKEDRPTDNGGGLQDDDFDEMFEFDE